MCFKREAGDAYSRPQCDIRDGARCQVCRSAEEILVFLQHVVLVWWIWGAQSLVGSDVWFWGRQVSNLSSLR